jgi:hypothetical protein
VGLSRIATPLASLAKADFYKKNAGSCSSIKNHGSLLKKEIAMIGYEILLSKITRSMMPPRRPAYWPTNPLATWTASPPTAWKGFNNAGSKWLLENL